MPVWPPEHHSNEILVPGLLQRPIRPFLGGGLCENVEVYIGGLIVIPIVETAVKASLPMLLFFFLYSDEDFGIVIDKSGSIFFCVQDVTPAFRDRSALELEAAMPCQPTGA